MAGSVAGTIQGESNGTPESMFAVASTIYNRLQGGYGPTAHDIVNQPNQYLAGSGSPSATAQQFATAIDNGTLGQYGNTGNAVNFRTAGYVNPDNPGSPGSQMGTGGYVIGGNAFSDTGGAPSANFVPPQYGAATTYGGNTGLFAPDYAFAGNPAGEFGSPVTTFGDYAPGYAFSGNPDIATAGAIAGDTGSPTGTDQPFSGNLGGGYGPNLNYGGGGPFGDVFGTLGDVENNLQQGGLAALGVPQSILDAASGGGAPQSTGPNTAPQGGDFFQNLLNDFWNGAQRGGLIILAIVLIGVGAFWLASGTKGGQAIMRATPLGRAT